MSNIVLTHEFGWRYLPAVQNMLIDTISISQYLAKARKFAKLQRDPNTPDGEPDSLELKIIGDSFELFCEFFVKFCGAADRRIAIKNYQLLDMQDNGVDAVGLDPETGQDVYLQYKCFNEHEFLTGGGRAHLDSFVAEVNILTRQKHPDPSTIKMWPRMIVITSAAGIHRYTQEEKYKGEVECISIAQLKHLTNTPSFWDGFRNAVN